MRTLPLAMLALFTASCAHADPGILWVPERMIAGHAYHGMILMEDAAPSGRLALLSAADGHIVDVPDSVSIPPYMNHGVFPIIPLSGGSTEIFAASGDAGLQSARTEVISPRSEPAKLRVIPASPKTLADSMLAYVLVLDEGGSPVRVRGDLNVHLASSGSIGAPHGVTVRNGTYYASIEIDVGGTGHVAASADGLKPHRADIERAQGDITVRLAVAPDIAMRDSHAFYYVWLEKDGRPFRPPHAVDVFLHSGNADTASLSPAPGSGRYGGELVRLVDGVAKGVLYTGGRGQAVITASTAEFGSGHDELFVGPARVDLSDGGASVPIHRQNLVGDDPGKDAAPDMLLSWIYPSVTDGRAWAVVAAYHADRIRELGMVAEGGAVTGAVIEDITITPARLDGRTVIYASSNGGIEHKGAYTMREALTKTNAMEFEISGASHGEHELAVSGPGLEPGTARVRVVPEHSERFSLGIAPIPALPGAVQDVAMVSVLDESGAAVDLAGTLGPGARFLVHSDSARISGDAAPRSNSAVVRGSLEGPARITAILDGVESAVAELVPSRVATSLEILAPDTVHIDEGFPFIVHHVDSSGTPVGVASDLRISSSLGAEPDGGHLRVGDPGTGRISVISGVGASEHGITAVANTMDVDLRLDRAGLRVGQDAVLEVLSSVDAAYDLLTDIPFARTGDSTFVLTPDREDDSATVTLLATQEGYEPVSISETLEVREVYRVDVRITDPSGSRLDVPFEVVAGGARSLEQPPYSAEHRPGEIVIDLPAKHTVHGHGYAARSVAVDGAERAHSGPLEVSLAGDLTVEAVYAREILVTVSGGRGSGVYGYGDAVTIDAPDRDRLSFLVRDVFERWEGPDVDPFSSKQTFAAVRDVSISAVYREDYAYLMAVIAIPLLGAGGAVLYRNAAGFRWRVENLLERAAGMISAPKARKQRPGSKTGPAQKNT